MPDKPASFLGGLGMQAASSATGAIMGLALGGINDRRQIKQQAKLNEQQMAYDKNMTAYNMDQQLKMWKDTSYGPQKEQMKAAGINPALMYGMGGGGGQTANIEASGGQGGKAPSGGGEAQMGMALQMGLMKAQIDNINADTKDKLASVPKKGEETTSLNLANKWEAWKQSHNEEGYKIIEGQAYDKDGNKVDNTRQTTWKESENKMQWDKLFNEIDGIIKNNNLTVEKEKQVKEATAEIGQKIELLKSQKANTDEATNNLKKEGLIKDFEVEMNKVGLTHSSISDILKLLLHKIL